MMSKKYENNIVSYKCKISHNGAQSWINNTIMSFLIPYPIDYLEKMQWDQC